VDSMSKLVCKNCGYENKSTMKFCVNCGTKLEKEIVPVENEEIENRFVSDHYPILATLRLKKS